MAYDKEAFANLILERARKSKLYNNLSAEKQSLFLQDVHDFASHILAHSTSQTIKHSWKLAAYEPAADNLLFQLKQKHRATFGLPQRSGSFESAIRNASRDVLFVIINPKAHANIKELHTIRRIAPSVSANGILSGRTFKTNESQPPTTGARTLRRRK